MAAADPINNTIRKSLRGISEFWVKTVYLEVPENTRPSIAATGINTRMIRGIYWQHESKMSNIPFRAKKN